MSKDWAEELLKMAEKDFKNSAQSNSAFVEETKKDILKINIKLERLLNGYLDQIIEQDIYRVEKGKLLFTKKSLEAKISSLFQKQNNWLVSSLMEEMEGKRYNNTGEPAKSVLESCIFA